MNICIYCKEPLVPKGETPHPKNPSLEHVVPWALGGSDGCATKEACNDCNSVLGRTVDSDCINQTLVTMIRQQFGIASYSGNIPDVVADVRSTAGNEPARMTIPAVGEAVVKHQPIVIRQEETYGEQVLVVGNESDVNRIVGGLAAKATKQGNSLIDPATGKPMDFPSSIAAAPRDGFSEYKAEMSLDLSVIHRQIVKIAFGFAHLTLGWAWTGSPKAEAMRAVARGRGGRSEVDALVTGIKPEIRANLPMGNAKPTDHLLVLMPAGAPFVVVSLFGEPLLTAAVRLDVDEDIIAERLVSNDRAMATIDPNSRRTTWVGLFDLVTHMTRQSGA